MSSVDTQLHAALVRALAGVSYDALRSRARDLSTRYRNAAIVDATPALRDELDCLAYAVTRMPATYRAIQSALRAADIHIGPARTHLDLGGGTGSAAWAAVSVWPDIQTTTLERQPAAVALGRQLASAVHLMSPVWVAGDLRDWRAVARVDVVTAAYVLNELTPRLRRQVVVRAADAADTIVLVEPGTPRGFRNLLEARIQLLGLGMTVAAPCPHQLACPLTGADWCHFAVRLPRTELHRRLKGGARNFEDEKFSYLVATRRPARPAAARVLRPPLRPKNQVQLALCTSDGERAQVRIPKSAPEYSLARSVGQGDTWPGQRS